MTDKTWKITVTAGELGSLINYNVQRLYSNYDVKYSERIHDLTKRLNRKETVSATTDETTTETNVPQAWS